MPTITSTPLPPPYGETYWAVSEAALAIFTLCTLYLLLAVTCYAFRLRGTTNRLLIGFCIISIAAALARMVSDHTVAFIGWQSDSKCEATASASFAFYTCSIYSAYLLFWCHQKAFYDSSTLSHLVNVHVTWISYVTLAIFAVSGVVLTVLLQVPSVTGWNFRATAAGCRDASDSQGPAILPLLVSLVTSLAQMALLSLLLYPLITNKKRQEIVLSPRIVKRRTSHRRKVSTESQQALVSPTHRDHVAASSDDESVRSHRSWSTNSAFSESEAVFHDYHDFTSRSEHESDDERKPSTSRSRMSSRSSTKFSFDTKPKGSGLYEKNPHATHARGRGDLRTAVCNNMMCRMIRKRYDTMQSRERKFERKRERKMKQLIRKVFFLTTMCVASDIFFTVVQLRFAVPELTYLTIFDINLLINIVCIILTFKDWKKILTSPFPSRWAGGSRRPSQTNRRSSRTRSQQMKSLLNHSTVRKESAPDAESNNSTGFAVSAPSSPEVQVAPVVTATFEEQTTNL